MTEGDTDAGRQSLGAWAFVRQTVEDMTAMVVGESETELELLEGLRVLGRVTALCAELSLDVDPQAPWFFSMNSEARLVGGPNPDGEYHLAMIDGRRRYRITGERGTVTYLGIQVLAGRGLTPRRQAAYLSDTQLEVDRTGAFSLVLATERPSPAELDGSTWVPIPEDASAVLVRQYVADRATEVLAGFRIRSVDPVGPPDRPSDQQLSEGLNAMGWTIIKLMTLHRTVLPELLDRPNQLVTAEAATLGGENTTPDNLYMLGTFRLEEGQALALEFTPPGTRYWSVSVENIWHECIDPRRRTSSATNATAPVGDDGLVRLVIGDRPPGGRDGRASTWLDTGGRHRGFLTLRWLDHPEPPAVATSVLAAQEV